VTREERLARTLVELADSLVDDFDVVDLTVLLTERCVEILDASAAGLVLVNGQGSLTLMAATSEATEVVELFQIQNDEGPCRDCFHTGMPVSVGDLAQERARWPRFAPVALESGFRAANAVPLRLRAQVLGALNLFRAEPAMLERADLAVAQAFADIATIAVLQNRAIHESHLVADQLEGALQSRILIEQAKGILAQGAGLGMDEAFSRLRRFARSSQRHLSDVAQDIVDGTLRPADLLAVGR
jgi:transcriptional regulator with GAF, ATPase, and Fis domain